MPSISESSSSLMVTLLFLQGLVIHMYVLDGQYTQSDNKLKGMNDIIQVQLNNASIAIHAVIK